VGMGRMMDPERGRVLLKEGRRRRLRRRHGHRQGWEGG
jgi:hypothetical protein